MTPEELAFIRRSALDENLHAWDSARPVLLQPLDWIDTLQTDRRVTDSCAHYHMLRARDLQRENAELRHEIEAWVAHAARFAPGKVMRMTPLPFAPPPVPESESPSAVPPAPHPSRRE
jgi:hypothetical protein